MLESGIIALLSSNAGLTALIGAQIYPVVLPENSAYPCLTYQVVSGNSYLTLDGVTVTTRRIQFDAWSTQYSDVRSTQVALHNVLDAYAGTLSGGTKVLTTSRGVEMDWFASDSRLFRATTEFVFQFVE